MVESWPPENSTRAERGSFPSGSGAGASVWGMPMKWEEETVHAGRDAHLHHMARRRNGRRGGGRGSRAATSRLRQPTGADEIDLSLGGSGRTGGRNADVVQDGGGHG